LLQPLKQTTTTPRPSVRRILYVGIMVVSR
jgi:hypothetical protein